MKSLLKSQKWNNPGNLLGYLYHQKYYKRISTDLPRQTNTNILQQIKFTGKLRKDDCVTTFFVSEKNYSKFLFRFINCDRII